MTADLNTEFRKKLQTQGKALPPNTPGGQPRFPINDASDVKSAVGLVGQVPDSEKPKVRKHIIKNAKKVSGGVDHVPDTWNADGTTK